MKIGFEAKRAFFNHTGLGNYARNLITGLYTYYNSHEYFLYTTPLKDRDSSFIRKLPRSVRIIEPRFFVSKIFSSLWRSHGMYRDIKRDQIDIFHGLSHELPYGLEKQKALKIVTIHDLIYLRHPEFFPLIDRKIYDHKFRYACSVADKIIAISAQTKDDLVNYFHIPDEKVVIHHQSCNPLFFERPTFEEFSEMGIRRNLPSAYLLYVGALSERKNVISIIRALAKLPPDVRIPLVVVGSGESYKRELIQEASKLRVSDLIRFEANVSTKDLRSLYFGATAFIYPSFFEGFGIPIIEAQFMGTPVITSRGSCFSESGGLHTTYIDPHSVEELAYMMERVLSNQEHRLYQSKTGLQFVQRFHLSETTRKLHEIYFS